MSNFWMKIEGTFFSFLLCSLMMAAGAGPFRVFVSRAKRLDLLWICYGPASVPSESCFWFDGLSASYHCSQHSQSLCHWELHWHRRMRPNTRSFIKKTSERSPPFTTPMTHHWRWPQSQSRWHQQKEFSNNSILPQWWLLKQRKSDQFEVLF